MLVNASNLGTKRDKKGQVFFCKFCDYNTTHHGHWERHLKTKKHKNQKMLVNASTFKKRDKNINNFICECGKSYLHDSSYYRHKIKCKKTKISSQINNDILSNIESDTLTPNSNIIEHFNKLFLEQKKQHIKEKTELIEIIKSSNNIKTQVINGNNNHTIQNNFNIQLFLDEKCNNAVSIQEFAKQLKITIEDLSLLKNNEQKAMTNIIVNNLKDYTDFDRPVHKHEQKWYIKDKKDGWDKEGDYCGDKIVKNIKIGVSQKAANIFIENNPDFLSNDKKESLYTETISVAMKNIKERDTNKILKNIEKYCEV